MKKFAVVMLLALTMVGSSFATDSVVSVSKPVAKTAGTVVKHVAVDAFAAGKHLGKDAYSVGKYLVVGLFKGGKHTVGDVKTVVAGAKK